MHLPNISGGEAILSVGKPSNAFNVIEEGEVAVTVGIAVARLDARELLVRQACRKKSSLGLRDRRAPDGTAEKPMPRHSPSPSGWRTNAPPPE